MSGVEMNQPTFEDQRAEQFRQFQAEQMRAQTKSLDTIRSLLILWTVLVAIGFLFALIGAFAS